jgi:hypothetical protein
MLVQTSRLLRLSLIAALAGATAWSPLFIEAAWAQDDDEEDSDEGDDGGGDDEGGGDDDEGGGSEEEEEEEVEEDQPPVTAGGLFTKKTYPQAELARPLTLSKGMKEIKAGLGFDISSARAFESVGALVEGRYGVADNVEVQAGFKGIYNFSFIEAFAAFEASIVYDLVDFRVAPRFSFCSPREDDMGNPEPPVLCAKKDGALHLDVGFPFRYAPKPQVGIVALDTLITIDTEGEDGNAKPDLNPSIGIIVQPVPIVAILVEAQLLIKNFETDKDNFQVPATLTVQLSPTNLIDIGAEFTLQNLKAKEVDDGMGGKTGGPFAERFLVFYGQLRL